MSAIVSNVGDVQLNLQVLSSTTTARPCFGPAVVVLDSPRAVRAVRAKSRPAPHSIPSAPGSIIARPRGGSPCATSRATGACPAPETPPRERCAPLARRRVTDGDGLRPATQPRRRPRARYVGPGPCLGLVGWSRAPEGATGLKPRPMPPRRPFAFSPRLAVGRVGLCRAAPRAVRQPFGGSEASPCSGIGAATDARHRLRQPALGLVRPRVRKPSLRHCIPRDVRIRSVRASSQPRDLVRRGVLDRPRGSSMPRSSAGNRRRERGARDEDDAVKTPRTACRPPADVRSRTVFRA